MVPQRIYGREDDAVWIAAKNWDWSKLPASIRRMLLDGLENVAAVRAQLSASCKVWPPPIEVVCELWTVEHEGHIDSSIDGCAGPLEWRKHTMFGVQSSTSAALCRDASALRKLLVHEYLHCFKVLGEIVDNLDAGIHSHDLTGDKFNREWDDSQLAAAEDWFSDPQDFDLMHHDTDEQTRDALQESFTALLPDLKRGRPGAFHFTKVGVPDDVREHVRRLRGNSQ